MTGDRVPWTSGAVKELSSVWVAGDRSRAGQLRDYEPGTEADIELVWPAVAAFAVARYSKPGAVVVDPDCGAGTVVVEAVRAGRHAVGITAEPRWWGVARANITRIKGAGACTDGSVLDTGDMDARVRQSGLSRRANLVLTGIRAVSPDSDWESDVRSRVRVWSELVRPGGYVVVVVRPRRDVEGVLLDVPTAVLDGGVCAGLLPVDRCVALLPGDEPAAVREVGGVPVARVGHHVVLVFRAPGLREGSQFAEQARWVTV